MKLAAISFALAFACAKAYAISPERLQMPLTPAETKCVTLADTLEFALKCVSRQKQQQQIQQQVDSAAGSWRYSTEVDQMNSSQTRYADIDSDNSLDLAFPYKGPNHGSLQIRQRKKDGLNVIFFIQKGQIICRSYDGCQIEVRFNDAQPVKFHGSGPDDHSSTAVFLSPASRFVEQAKKARQIRVAVTIYQAGTQVLEFNTLPLVWK